jgi:hypothetical protein
LHRSERFTNEEFGDQTVLLLPLFSEKGFDTSSSISDSVLGRMLADKRKDLTIFFRPEFERRYAKAFPDDTVASFYKILFNGDILSLQTLDSAWTCMPSNYVIAVRVADAGRVKDFHGVMKRKLSLEAEIWKSKTAEVVWRGRTDVFDPEANSTDSEFIKQAVERIYEIFPDYHPGLHEEDW